MPTIQVNDLRMYYEIHGEGEPLALILGMTTDLSEWQRIIQPLAQHYKVIAFDNRGAGRTDKPDQIYTVEMMAEDTEGLLRALGIARADILGVSLGGRIALALALAHPERVNRLILVSTSARVSRRPWWFGLAGMLSRAPILGGAYPQPAYAFRRQRQASTSFNCTDRLGEIHTPTLIMNGKRDRTVPFPLAEELHAGIADSRLIAFADGHIFLLFSERQPFLDAVTAFLGE